MTEYTSRFTESTSETTRSREDVPAKLNMYQVLAKSSKNQARPTGQLSWKDFKHTLNQTEGQWKADTEQRRQVVQERVVARHERKSNGENSQQNDAHPHLAVNRTARLQSSVSDLQVNTPLANSRIPNIPANKTTEKPKKLRGLARVFGSYRAVPLDLRSEENSERFEFVDEPDCVSPEDSKIYMQKDDIPSLNETHDQIDFIVGPGHQYRHPNRTHTVKRVTKTVDLSLPRNYEEHGRENDYVDQRDQQDYPNKFVEYRESGGEEDWKDTPHIQHTPVPPSTSFTGRRPVARPSPRLAYNTKRYKTEEGVQKRHQGPVVTSESVDRLSQPPRRVLEELEFKQSQEHIFSQSPPWVANFSKSLADLNDLPQPRLAYSRKNDQHDHTQRELEYYQRKKQQKKPIDQESVDRLSKPSPRYLTYRRLEDVYQDRLEEVIQKRPESKKNRALFGSLTKAKPRLKRNSTLEDWELHYKESKKASLKKRDDTSKKRQVGQSISSQKVDWYKKEQYYLDKIKQVRKKQLQEKKLQQALHKYKQTYQTSRHRSRSFERRQFKRAESRSRSASRSQKERGGTEKPIERGRSPLRKNRTQEKQSTSHPRKTGLGATTELRQRRTSEGANNSRHRSKSNQNTKPKQGESEERRNIPRKAKNTSRPTTSRHREARSLQRSHSQGKQKAQTSNSKKTVNSKTTKSSKTRLPSIIKKPSKLPVRKPSAKRKSAKRIRFVTPNDKKMLGSYNYGNYHEEAPSTPRMRRSKRYANTPSRLLDHFNRSNNTRSHRETKEGPWHCNPEWGRNSARMKKKPVTTYRKIRRTPPASAVRRKMSGRPRVYPDNQRSQYNFEHLQRNLDFDDEYDDYKSRLAVFGRSQYDDDGLDFGSYNNPTRPYTPNIGSRKQDTRQHNYSSRTNRTVSRKGHGHFPNQTGDMKAIVPTSKHGVNQERKYSQEEHESRGRKPIPYDDLPSMRSPRKNDVNRTYYNDKSVRSSFRSTRSLHTPDEPIRLSNDDRVENDLAIHLSEPARAESLRLPELDRVDKDLTLHHNEPTRVDPLSRPNFDRVENDLAMQLSQPSKAESIRLPELDRVDKDLTTHKSEPVRADPLPLPNFDKVDNDIGVHLSEPARAESPRQPDLDKIDYNVVTHHSVQERRNTRSSRRAREGLHQSNNNNHIDDHSPSHSVTSLRLTDTNKESVKTEMPQDQIQKDVALRPIVMSTQGEDYNDMAEKASAYTNDSDETLDLDLPMARSEISSSRAAFHVDHAKWPTYRFERNGGLACLVRASPSHMDDMKQGLRLVDRIPREVSNRLPPLPFMDFDQDESVAISPMQLMWEHPQKKLPNMEEPIYLLLPLNRELYNENLQQVFFFYTSDLQQWRYAQGRVTRLPVEDKEYDFLEVIIHDPFRYIIFDIKARFIEDVRTLPSGGGELVSSMDPGVHVRIAKRSFDGPAKVKLRVEPLDMNELDLSLLIPSMNAMHACAVSPIIKISASKPSKRPLSVFVPKPGHSLYGSHKLGLRCKLQDLRSQKVYLFTKDRQIMRYQVDSALQREFANEYEFQVTIWKAGGCAYAFLVLEGTQPQSAEKSKTSYSDDEGFLHTERLKALVSEIDPDDRKVRSLGIQLLNSNAARELQKQQRSTDPSDVRITATKILRRWTKQHSKQEDGVLVRHLVLIFREIGMTKAALDLQRTYKDHLLSEEGKRLGQVFGEIKSCPTVLIHWKQLGQALGLSDADLQHIDNTQRKDLSKRCSCVLKKAFEQWRQEEQFYRDILIRYIRALHRVGCPRIAASIERRHLNKFYSNGAQG